MPYDAIIIGGSYAGLSAAMQLARARRRILVIDEGQRRNRFAAASHGFLGQDGRAPDAIASDAKAELLRYPTVEWLEDRAQQAGGTEDDFTVTTAAHGELSARRLVLALGVTDDLPSIAGLTERWGRSIFHCPYCHGYELDQGDIAVIASSHHSMHQALMLPDWGKTTLMLNGCFTPDQEQLQQLQDRGVTIEPRQVQAITSHADITFADGRTLSFAGLFVLPQPSIATPLAEQLGCELEDDALYPCIKTGFTKETTVSGVFACGDAARPAGSVALAVGDGNVAGVAAHQSLVFRKAEA
ncbi:NAD(P)/FAD-dependent oxidoreductase [Rhizobium deserti]|uniref:Thioredoxin reductase n=1 Tax=Rhizobium deserti TaxID=2547961 RepID=A0A4R5ULE4_9HYPH|nr:NAD(P)/FAD-dependent oxidoreductase [Rhizobium deserti]TDK37643.1 NAD(P)/FAD-dependent oxidoreductase [Rhizobium deserti]